MTKSTEYGAAEHMVVGAITARLPVVVAAAALPVCGLLMLGISPACRTSLHLQRPSEAVLVVVVSGTTPCAMWPRVSAPK